MGDWKTFADKIKELLKSKNLSSAKEELATGLEKFPNQVNLLTIATNVYRASGDREKSLEYSELLITHHPDNWNGYGRAAQDLSVLKRLDESQEKIQTGLEKFPNQVNLLTIATNVYRASGNREKSLEYSKLLINHHPDNWNGYGHAAQDLVALKRFEEAQEKVQAGLEKFPNQVNLLTIATNVYRASGNREKSLEYSKLLINHHPDNWNGYGHAAQDLVALKRFEEAQEKVQAGLEKFPNQINLKRLSAYTTAFNGSINTCISDLEKESLSMGAKDLISYSSSADFFKIIQSKRSTITPKTISHKKYLFVGGLGRSGTTALGSLLNVSSKIAMYTELLSPYRLDGYSQHELSEEVVSKTPKSHRHYKRNATILRKSINAEFVGDKRPSFQFCAESSFDNLGIANTKCIYIDRSLVDICRSSHKRSENPNDNWPLEKGIEYTILLYNASCRQIIHLHDNRPDIFSSFLFPTYEDVFSSPEKAIKLFEFCGVELSDDEIFAVNNFVKKSQKYVDKKNNPNDPLEMHIRKSIALLLDRKVHEHFCDITGNYRNYLTF